MRRSLGPRGCLTSRTRRRCWLPTRPRSVAFLPLKLAHGKVPDHLFRPHQGDQHRGYSGIGVEQVSQMCVVTLLRTSCTSSDTALRTLQGL